MKISLNWIRQYTNIEISEEELISKIRSQIGEVESIENSSVKYKNILLAEIIERRDHPDAEKLAVYTLNIGNDKEVQVVAGDKTLEAGNIVAYFKPGAKLPFNAHPEKTDGVVSSVTLRGVKSEGMMASARELDLGTDHTIVMRLDTDLTPGTPMVQVLDMDDTIIEIENKGLTNRADCFGLIGIAREISGIQNIGFVTPEWMTSETTIPKSTSTIKLPLTIDIEAKNLCPRYVGATISNIEIKESPLWLQSLIVKSGMRPINNVVDITNYIMLLTGQPLHAFDYDKVKAKDPNSSKSVHIVIRTARPNEKLTTLDGTTHELSDTNLMICDSTNPIAVGGIMGGYDTEIDKDTKNIILESASFDLYNIRKSSMQLGIFTDAVTRFAKGQDPNQCDNALYKAVELISELASGKLIEVQDIFPGKKQRVVKTITISLEKLNAQLGTELSLEEVIMILNNVELLTETEDTLIHVTIPTYRGDLHIDRDIHEEVGRLYGYNNIKVTLPRRTISPASRNKLLDLKSTVRQILTENGASEILTYNFTSTKEFEKHNLNLENSYKLTNAISPELQCLRTLLLPSLLEKLKTNLNKNEQEIALYEINKAHNKKIIGADGLPYELQLASLVTSISGKKGRETSAYFQAKFYLDQLLKRLKISNLYLIHRDKLNSDNLPLWILESENLYDSNASAIILHKGESGDNAIGIIGEISPNSKEAIKLPEYSAGFELDLEGLIDLTTDLTTYMEPSIYPTISNDICYVSDTDVPYQVIIGSLEEELSKNIDIRFEISPVDIYQSDVQKSEDKKQTTVTIELRHMKRTLTSSEVEVMLKKASRLVRRNTNAVVKEV